MDILTTLADGFLAILAYALVGLLVLVLGYVALDLVTPGKLGEVLYIRRSPNAAVVVASGLLAVGTIVTTAIYTTYDDLLLGLVTTFAYGLAGVVLLALSFLLVDLLTPGRLGELLTEERWHPASLVTAAAHLATGAILAAAIS